MSCLNLGVVGFVVGLSGIMLPGPLLIYIVSKGLEGKLRNTLFIILGHIFIEAATVILLLLGLKQLLGLRTVYNVLSLLGGGVLAGMGLYIIFKVGGMKLSLNKSRPFCQEEFLRSKKGQDKSINLSSRLILGGVFFTTFNPTFLSWWLSLGAALLSRALLVGLWGIVFLMVGHWLADFIWYFLVGFGVSRGKLWLTDKGYQLTLRILGIILTGLGGWFIIQVYA